MTDSMDKLELKSIPENITKVEGFVEELRIKYDIGDELYGNILISLTEAVNNAIIHGNGCDESKLVQVCSEYKEHTNKLLLKVEDQGSGFDHNNLPDPTNPENLEKITGRGVFLIKQLADMLLFEDDGRILEMHFRI